MHLDCFSRLSVLAFLLLNGIISFGQDGFAPEVLLSQYVRIPSVTGTERTAAEFLMQKCREAGLEVTVFTREEDAFNFSASLYPLTCGKPNIVLLNHCDVVDPGDERLWKYPPFSGTIADSAVWGRGAVDNKAMGIMQFLAMSSFTEKAKTHDLPYNVTLLTVSNEEKGGQLGAGWIVKNALELLHPCVVWGEGGAGADHVLYSDPGKTVYGISIAGKQGAWFELLLKNTGSGHGSAASSENVVNQMIDGLNRLVCLRRKFILTDASKCMMKSLSAHERGFFRLALRHPAMFLPLVKRRMLKHDFLSLIFFDNCNITRIYSAESAANSIPSEVKAVLDCRFLKPVNPEVVEQQIRQVFRNPALSVRLISASEPASCSVPDQYYNWMEQAILTVNPDAAVVPILFPAISDNNYFQNKGIPTYGLLPCRLDAGLVKGIHNANEHLPVSCLYQGIRLYTQLLQEALFPVSSPGK